MVQAHSHRSTSRRPGARVSVPIVVTTLAVLGAAAAARGGTRCGTGRIRRRRSAAWRAAARPGRRCSPWRPRPTWPGC
ncbi:hypothetical protein ACFQ9X_19710 [Catenulispora yoronensis]